MVLQRIGRETSLFVHFTVRDWGSTIIPSCFFALGAMKGLTYDVATQNYLTMVIWISLYIYALNLFTQVQSPEEDVINKPDRPIPCGEISIAGALRRCFVVWALFLSMSAFHPRILPETVTHTLVVCFWSTKAGVHWLGKNFVPVSAVFWAQLSAVRKLLAPHTTEGFRDIIAIAAWAGVAGNVQDFRDRLGDEKCRRYTLPIAFGDQTARYITAFFLIPLAYYFLWAFGLAKHAPLFLGLMHMLMAYRILRFRDARADHQTYTVSP